MKSNTTIKISNRKLPHDCLRKRHLVFCIGHFAVWASSMRTASKAVGILYEREAKPKGLPARGLLTIGRRKYWWCRYGFLDDPLVYANPIPKQFKGKSTPKKT